MAGEVYINNELVDLDEKPCLSDNSAPSDDFDHDIRLRGDARGKLTVGRSPKEKKSGKGMAKIHQLKMRGIVPGKRGQINMKRTFKTRISLKEVDFGGSANLDYTSDDELEDLEGRNLKSPIPYDEKIESHMKRTAFVKNFTEDVSPINFGDGMHSGWLN